MAFTYTKGSTADRDRLRVRIGDTQFNRAMFEDDELDDFLVEETSLDGATARAFENLAARFARDYTFSADGSSFQKGRIWENYMKLARQYRSRSRGTTMIPQRRIDGYSNLTDSDDVDAVAQESFDRL